MIYGALKNKKKTTIEMCLMEYEITYKKILPQIGWPSARQIMELLMILNINQCEFSR